MRKLSKVLAELMTDLSNGAQFEKPTTQRRIEAHAQALSKLAHDLNMKETLKPDLDPSVVILSHLFADEADQSLRALKQGQRSFARDRLRSLTGYCIACHTRTQNGPQFSSLPFEPTTEKLTSFEKGEFYTSTRQFDKAMEQFQSILEDELAPVRRSVEWERSARHALAIAVRVKKDPNLALSVIDRISHAKNAPYFLKRNAEDWRTSVENWKNEPSRKAQTEQGYETEAMRLLAEAHQLQKYPMDRSADVAYLRASAAIHEWMQNAPFGNNKSKAFLMAGICYEVLRPLQIGEIHEMYYEACIHQSPHTPTAESCYQRFEQSIFSGYTGSSGTHIPPEMKAKLQRLESLAHPLVAGDLSGDLTGDLK
jgi:cytochrome c553